MLPNRTVKSSKLPNNSANIAFIRREALQLMQEKKISKKDYEELVGIETAAEASKQPGDSHHKSTMPIDTINACFDRIEGRYRLRELREALEKEKLKLHLAQEKRRREIERENQLQKQQEQERQKIALEVKRKHDQRLNHSPIDYDKIQTLDRKHTPSAVFSKSPVKQDINDSFRISEEKQKLTNLSNFELEDFIYRKKARLEELLSSEKIAHFGREALVDICLMEISASELLQKERKNQEIKDARKIREDFNRVGHAVEEKKSNTARIDSNWNNVTLEENQSVPQVWEDKSENNLAILELANPLVSEKKAEIFDNEDDRLAAEYAAKLKAQEKAAIRRRKLRRQLENREQQLAASSSKISALEKNLRHEDLSSEDVGILNSFEDRICRSIADKLFYMASQLFTLENKITISQITDAEHLSNILNIIKILRRNNVELLSLNNNVDMICNEAKSGYYIALLFERLHNDGARRPISQECFDLLYQHSKIAEKIYFACRGQILLDENKLRETIVVVNTSNYERRLNMLMGLHPRVGEKSYILRFFGTSAESVDELGDRNLVKEIFKFI